MIDRRLLLLIVAVILIGGAAWYWWPTKREYANTPPRNSTVVLFGDSLARGYGASPGQDLAARLGERFGLKIANLGVVGDQSDDALFRVPQVVAMQPGLVIVIIGGNDMMRGVEKAQTMKNIRAIVEKLLAEGASVCLVGIEPPLMTGISYHSEFRAIADELKLAFVPDALGDILANPSLKADTVHPNSEGYGVLATEIGDAIEPIVLQMP
jgi:lysophospholipase L1-like esterase